MRNKVTEKAKRVILLTQETGHMNEDGSITGRDSTAKLEKLLKDRGCDVLQLKVADCVIHGDKLIYKGKPVNVAAYGSVMKRTWDGKFNSNYGTQIQAFLEEKGLFPNSPATAQLTTQNRALMQKVIQSIPGLKYPKSVAITSKAEIADAVKMLSSGPKPPAAKKPAFVLKEKQGVHGNNIYFFDNTQEDITALKEKLKDASPQNPYVFQEYIHTKLMDNVPASEKANASHERLIISRSGKDKPYEYIGGMRLQRNGSWMSNVSYNRGELHKAMIPTPSREFVELISTVADRIGLPQFGVDVVDTVDNERYVIEYNDSMGVTGELLEKQGVHEKYVDSFLARAEEHYKERTHEKSSASEIAR